MSPLSPLSKLPLWARAIAAAFLALLTIGVTVTIVDSPAPAPAPHKRTVTVKLGGPGQAKVTLSPGEQTTVANQAKAPDAEADLNAPAPAPATVRTVNRRAPAKSKPFPAVIPQAAPSTPGCTTALVRNYSSRNGAKVMLGIEHWTGSGYGSGEGIVRYFDTSAAQASSNYVLDEGGKCWLTVAESAKAWTQAGANPWSVSVEVVNPGVLPLFHDAAQRAENVRLFRRWHKVYGLPYRRGAVTSSCVPTRSGFLAHRDLGPCGGGHPDVGPSPATLDGLIATAKRLDAAAATPITAQDRTDCAEVRTYRARRPQTHHDATIIARRVDRVHAHRLYCASGRVHRRS